MTHDALRAEYDGLHQPGGVGVLPRPERALVQLAGPDRLPFLQGLVSNDVLRLTPGESVRAALLDSTAHLLAALRVHARPDCLYLEMDARCLPRLLDALDFYHIMEQVESVDVSGEWTCHSVLGAGAHEAAALVNVGNGFLAPAPLGDVSGVDVWLPVNGTQAVAGLAPLSEQVGEVLRVEAGEPAWGHELVEGLLLPEADQPDWVSYMKGCYVGQEVIARIHARGHANRLLRGILFGHDAPVPHAGDTLHAPEHSAGAGAEAGREIGRITSAVASPKFGGRALALGFVRAEYAANGTPLAAHLAQPDGTVFPFHAQTLTRPFAVPA